MTGYEIAKTMLGLHEVKDNAKIRQFLLKEGKDLDIDVSTTPWCAAFVNACERKAGNLGTGKLNARSFLAYGIDVPFKDVKKGDIAIFARGGSSWQGHVAYVDGIESNGLVRTLGGNQGDAVSIGWYHSDRLLAVRRPS